MIIPRIPRIYFAHPLTDYGMPHEARCLEEIAANWPGYEIVNPNQGDHHVAYQIQGMPYFYELVKTCDLLIAVPFRDGEWGMGVWAEAEAMARKGGQVFQLHKWLFQETDFRDIRPLSINETRRRRLDPPV